jgi:hypothetical protein
MFRAGASVQAKPVAAGVRRNAGAPPVYRPNVANAPVQRAAAPMRAMPAGAPLPPRRFATPPIPVRRAVQAKFKATYTGVNQTDNFWTQSAGYRNEAHANIAGNFPVIDHWESLTGVATSLKTMDVLRYYKEEIDGQVYFNDQAFTQRIREYAKALREFRGRFDVKHDKIKRKVLELTFPAAVRGIFPKVRQKMEECVAEVQEIEDQAYHNFLGTRSETVRVEIECKFSRVFSDSAVGYKLEKYHQAQIFGEDPGNTKTIDHFNELKKKVISYKTMDLNKNYQTPDRLKSVTTTLQGYLEALRTFAKNGSEKLPVELIEKAVLHVAVPPVRVVHQYNPQAAAVLQAVADFERDNQPAMVTNRKGGQFRLSVVIEEIGSQPEYNGSATYVLD